MYVVIFVRDSLASFQLAASLRALGSIESTCALLMTSGSTQTAATLSDFEHWLVARAEESKTL